MSQSGKTGPLRVEVSFQETVKRLLRVKKEEIQEDRLPRCDQKKRGIQLAKPEK